MQLEVEKPETQNRALARTGQAKPGETCRLTGTGPCKPRPAEARRVSGRVENRTDPSTWCNAGQLVG